MLFYIYKICCDNCEYIYVGSTRAFRQRKSQHKSDCNNETSMRYHNKLYQIIRDNGGWDNWRMVCIDEIEVENKRQAEMKEEEWRVILKANLNMIKAYQTEEEKRETKREYCKDYNEKNRDNILERKKVYYEKNKDKILKQTKEYQQKNREKIADKKKEYRQEKVICECGCEISRSVMSRHMKSIKHKNIIDSIK